MDLDLKKFENTDDEFIKEIFCELTNVNYSSWLILKKHEMFSGIYNFILNPVEVPKNIKKYNKVVIKTKIDDDMATYIKNNIQHEYVIVCKNRLNTFLFKNEQDAMKFKLRY
jgi:hypothetical protein